MIKKLTAALTVAVALLAGTVTEASATGSRPVVTVGHPTAAPRTAAEGEVLSGTGWNTETVDFGGGVLCPISSLEHGRTYTITFTDTASMNRLDPYALNAARQLNTMPSITGAGIHFAVTKVLSPLAEPTGAQYPSADALPYHISLTLRTSAQSGMSWTTPGVLDCRYAYGADIWITPEYWSTPDWFSTNTTLNTVRINAVVPHEIGHAMGLQHPADFTVPAGRAVPLMVPEVGGYQSITNGTKTPYTAYDRDGINNLVTNGGM
jgi:hypothetical protein